MADGRLLQSTDLGASWQDTGVDTGSIVAMAGV
jgi:hypothetical protein